VIRADRRVVFERVIAVLDQRKRAGVEKMAFAVEAEPAVSR
jgi:biopolymer transport protein ExbD